MSRRSRHEKRILKEQDTIGAQRAERKEQEELAGRKKMAAAALTKAQRQASLEEKDPTLGARPERIARIGKPLKRP